MRHHAGCNAADGMRHNGLGRQLAIAERIEQGCMRAELSAPAHSDGCEHGYGVAVYPSGAHKAGYKAERRSNGAESCYGECHLMRVVEAEKPRKQEVDLVG